MSLSDALEAAATTAPTIARRRTAPTGFELGVRYEAGNLASEVVLTTAEVPEDEKGWRDEIKRVYNVELPENRRVEIAQLRHWGNPAEPMIYVRYRITDRPRDREGEPMTVKLSEIEKALGGLCRLDDEFGLEPTDVRWVREQAQTAEKSCAALRDVLAILDEREAEMGDLALPDLRALIRDVHRAITAHVDPT